MNVLLIEDNPMNRLVIGAMLRAADLTMVEAEDGETGVQLMDEATYDLVLVDLRMPGMDGFTVIRKIRQRADKKAGVPIIVITADSAPDLHQRCMAAGADALLLKPVAMDALFDAISAALAKKSPEMLLI